MAKQALTGDEGRRMRVEHMVKRGLLWLGLSAACLGLAQAQPSEPPNKPSQKTQSASQKAQNASKNRPANKAAAGGPSTKKGATAKVIAPQRTAARQDVTPARPSFGQRAGLHGTPDPLDLKSSVALVIDQDTQQVLCCPSRRSPS